MGAMTVGLLKKIIKDLSDDTLVFTDSVDIDIETPNGSIKQLFHVITSCNGDDFLEEVEITYPFPTPKNHTAVAYYGGYLKGEGEGECEPYCDEDHKDYFEKLEAKEYPNSEIVKVLVLNRIGYA